MKRTPNKLKVFWEYRPAPDAEARLKAAFALIFSKELPPVENLTENEADDIMSHDEQDTSIS
jgi:hypothetical protein